MEDLSSIRSGFSVFNGIDFTILYDWFPADIESVITACIAAFLLFALLGLIRRFLLR